MAVDRISDGLVAWGHEHFVDDSSLAIVVEAALMSQKCYSSTDLSSVFPMVSASRTVSSILYSTELVIVPATAFCLDELVPLGNRYCKGTTGSDHFTQGLFDNVGISGLQTLS